MTTDMHGITIIVAMLVMRLHELYVLCKVWVNKQWREGLFPKLCMCSEWHEHESKVMPRVIWSFTPLVIHCVMVHGREFSLGGLRGCSLHLLSIVNDTFPAWLKHGDWMWLENLWCVCLEGLMCLMCAHACRWVQWVAHWHTVWTKNTRWMIEPSRLHAMKISGGFNQKECGENTQNANFHWLEICWLLYEVLQKR